MNIERQSGELKLIAASLNKRVHDVASNLSPEQKQNESIMEGLESLENAMQLLYATARRFEGAL